MNSVCFVVLVAVTLFGVLNAESRFGGWPDKCLDGSDRNAKPSVGTEDFVECKSYEKKMSCCPAERTRRIKERDYNYIKPYTDICGPLSDNCKRFFLDTECFFACEPMLQHYGSPNDTELTEAAPLCATYCNDWFDACKDDKTCVKDLLAAVRNSAGFTCPSDGSTCVTFAEMYGNGKGLCETMWSFLFAYEASDKNCMVPKFSGENPNLNGDPYKEEKKKNSAGKMTTSLLKICLVFFSVCLFVF